MHRRKLFKYDQFSQSPNCFMSTEFASGTKLELNNLNQYNQIIVELGAGSCNFSLQLAETHPECLVIAIDKKRDRLLQGSRVAATKNLRNIVFVNGSAEAIGTLLPPSSVSQIWITFPDPYFKKRHIKHRMINQAFLDSYAQILRPQGQLYVKTDNSNFLADAAGQLEHHPRFEITMLETDLASGGQDESNPIYFQTKYEQLWRDAGLSIGFLAADKLDLRGNSESPVTSIE